MKFPKVLTLTTIGALSISLLTIGLSDTVSAKSKWRKNTSSHVVSHTVTTTTVTTRTVTKRVRSIHRKSEVRKQRYRAKRHAPKRQLAVRKVRAHQPKNFRHTHPGHDFGYHRHQNGHIVHKHGRHQFHSHGQRDFIHIKPHQKSWLGRRSDLTTSPTFPWAIPLRTKETKQLALVVVEQKAGVNIIRNVKTFTSKPTREVRQKSTIGSSNLVSPARILTEREISACKRRLKTIAASDSVTIIRGGAGYCQ